MYRLRGKVVSGFGRGSKLLGCPTANLDPAAFSSIVVGAPRGVYAGFAQVGPDRSSPVYKTVLSFGTNPSFADSQHDTVESYILHDFSADFYDQELSLVIVAYMRPMEKYEGMEKLVAAIARDVRVGDVAMEREPFSKFKQDEFFKKTQ